MPKRSWVLRLIMLLVAVLILPTFAAAKPTTPAPASPGAALQVARHFVARVAQNNEIPEWTDVALGSPALFETPDGAPSVYVIDVKAKGGSAAGFVVVSADETTPRVVEFSQAEAPHLRVAQAQAKSARSDTPQLVHAGPSIFLARFGTSGQSDRTTVNLMSLDTVETTAIVEPTAEELSPPPDETATESPMVDIITPENLITSKKITYFPTTYDQATLNYYKSACGPAAGATILWYWSKVRGYSSLTSGYTTWTSFGNHMRADMLTEPWGTTVSNFAAGIKKHGVNHGGRPYMTTSYYNSTSSDYYANYKSEIGYNR
ncbi:MAG TPA: hypothetical protein VK191_16320, partial [Symbiobacteriaceae bacterium]|nr:hypothetical protein [Symbiobacteriaceae bacterium]